MSLTKEQIFPHDILYMVGKIPKLTVLERLRHAVRSDDDIVYFIAGLILLIEQSGSGTNIGDIEMADLTAHNISPTAHPDIRAILNTLIKMPEWDSATNTLTFTPLSGAPKVIDLRLELLRYGLNFDASTNELVFTHPDGTETRALLSALIDIYTGFVGQHIETTTTGNIVKAFIRPGTISEVELTPDVVAKIDRPIPPQTVIPPEILAMMTGGRAGQVWGKRSDNDADMGWIDIAQGGSPPEEILPREEYTGEEIPFTFPAGTHRIKIAGGKGSSNGDIIGGLGDIVEGTVTLDSEQNVYIYLGASGELGGWNGGGQGKGTIKRNGGGAGDIRLVGGNWDNQTGLYSRLIVAPGGGGSAYTVATAYNSSTRYEGTPGTFGIGGTGIGTNDSGGGGGYEGGKSGGFGRKDSWGGFFWTSPTGNPESQKQYEFYANLTDNTVTSAAIPSRVSGYSGLRAYNEITGVRLNGITGYDVTETWANSIVASTSAANTYYPVTNSLGSNIADSVSFASDLSRTTGNFITWDFVAKKQLEDGSYEDTTSRINLSQVESITIYERTLDPILSEVTFTVKEAEGFFGGIEGEYSPGESGTPFISGIEGFDSVDENGNFTGQPNHYSGITFTEEVINNKANEGDGWIEIILNYNPVETTPLKYSLTEQEQPSFPNNYGANTKLRFDFASIKKEVTN